MGSRFLFKYTTNKIFQKAFMVGIAFSFFLGAEDLFEGGDLTTGRIKKAVMTLTIKRKEHLVTNFGFYDVPDGSGSAVVIGDDGSAITTLDVVRGAAAIYGRLGDLPEMEYIIFGEDPFIGLALLAPKQKPPSLEFLPFATNLVLRTGETLVAVGSPAKLGTTFTRGILSYENRSSIGVYPVERYLQTSAAISPGMEGGALVNSRGELLGLCARNPRFAAGLGFAIPKSLLEPAIKALQSRQVRPYPWLGVFTREAGRGFEDEAGIDPGCREGLVVWSLSRRDPALGAGLAFKDVLIGAEGQALRSYDDLAASMAIKKPGDTLSLSVRRGGETLAMNVTLGAMPLVPRFTVEQFFRQFLSLELRVGTNTAPSADGEDRSPYTFSVAMYLGAEKNRLQHPLKEGMELTRLQPGNPYGSFETIRDPEHLENLLDRCYLTETRSAVMKFVAITKTNAEVVRRADLDGVVRPTGYAFTYQSGFLKGGF